MAVMVKLGTFNIFLELILKICCLFFQVDIDAFNIHVEKEQNRHHYIFLLLALELQNSEVDTQQVKEIILSFQSPGSGAYYILIRNGIMLFSHPQDCRR